MRLFKKYTIESDTNDLKWIVLNDPTPDALNHLKKNYKFHKLDIEDCLSKAQRSKIDEYPNYLFSVLNIPIRKNSEKEIEKSQIYFFLGKNFVITIHDNDKHILNLEKRLKTNKKLKANHMGGSPSYLLYMIIDGLFESVLPLLDDMQEDLFELEHEIFDNSSSTDKLKDILALKKDIINFRRIILPERTLVVELDHKSRKYDGEGLEVYFDDIVDKVEKIWNNLENMNEILVSLFETNESLTSHNTNNTIKMLTIFSVLIMPMTLITGFYGMNVKGLPLAEHPLSTLVISLGFVFLALLMITFFRWKKWI
ncbi:MAG: magnesium transporter CorA family protein [Candidatus Gracilibacteria bacterium]|jgi:magnesium transporter|nr:magnesium transporter CorA family protein [Candidatus Gracilibacteria bacterium]